jgi:alpha-beta hydrolase superfamily lysophospholipase
LRWRLHASLQACAAIVAAEVASEQHPPPTVLVGSSWGARVVLYLVSTGGWNGPTVLVAPALAVSTTGIAAAQAAALRAAGGAVVGAAVGALVERMLPWLLWVDPLGGWSPTGQIPANVANTMHVVHGSDDQTIPVECTSTFCKSVRACGSIACLLASWYTSCMFMAEPHG